VHRVRLCVSPQPGRLRRVARCRGPASPRSRRKRAKRGQRVEAPFNGVRCDAPSRSAGRVRTTGATVDAVAPV